METHKKPVCGDCMHFKICQYWEATARDINHRSADGLVITEDEVATDCKYFACLVPELSAEWVRHEPDPELMRFFHHNQIGKGMGVNSIFWVCSNCGGYGTRTYRYCSQCGAKMRHNGKEL